MFRLRKTFSLGKIDYNGSGRRNCEVTVDVRLRYRNDEPEFSASAYVWNPRRTDIYTGGQIFDGLKCYMHSPLFDKIYEYWKQYHLNTMHAGTPEQEDALEQWHESLQGHDKIALFDYKRDCEYLKSIGLYEVEWEGQPYRYGSAWLTRPIPEDVVEEIISLIQGE